VKDTFTNEYNPFNSAKLYAQISRWEHIKRGEPLPPPIGISLDLSSRCNLACSFCNASVVMKNNHNDMSKETIEELCSFLGDWEVGGYKVKTACIGGNGESTMNKSLDDLISGLYSNGIKAGLVTNGVKLLDHQKLGMLEWIGVSIDAGTKATYKQIKGRDMFDEVIENIREFNSMTYNQNIQKVGQGHGVSYKYLLTPNNVSEIEDAAILALGSGCRNLHIRPVSDPWDRKLNQPFTDKDIKTFQEELEKARALANDSFGVFGVTHKFDGNLNKVNNFNKCYGVLMTCAISPPRGKEYKFAYQACCDRRGDDKLVKDFKSFEEFKKFWGSEEHWKLEESICPTQCPRCTLGKHNQIYENAILKENMTIDFI